MTKVSVLFHFDSFKGFTSICIKNDDISAVELYRKMFHNNPVKHRALI